MSPFFFLFLFKTKNSKQVRQDLAMLCSPGWSPARSNPPVLFQTLGLQLRVSMSFSFFLCDAEGWTQVFVHARQTLHQQNYIFSPTCDSPVSGSPECWNCEHGALCFVLIHFAMRLFTCGHFPYTRTDKLNLNASSGCLSSVTSCTHYTLSLRFIILLFQVPKCWDYSSAIFFPSLS